MKNLIKITVLLFTLSISSQEVPQDGRRTMKVKEKFVGEYNQEVRGFFHDNMEVNFSNKIEKKLVKKYGFTNVKVVSIGAVTSPEAWYNKLADIAPLSNKDMGVILLNQADNLGQVVRAADVYVTPDSPDSGNVKYQANITSDQGTFKIRINMFGGMRYIIKESNVSVSIQGGKIVSQQIIE